MEILIKRSNFIFWQKWLFYSSLFFALAGIGFAFFGKSFLFQPYEQMLASAFWKSKVFPPDAEIFRAFIYIPFGGTISCCYILLAFIAYYPFKEKKIWARNAIIVAYGVWVIIDSGACIYFGIFGQIYIINAFSIITKALPIIFTWRDFKTQRH
jgi:hypothetical protein